MIMILALVVSALSLAVAGRALARAADVRDELEAAEARRWNAGRAEAKYRHALEARVDVLEGFVDDLVTAVAKDVTEIDQEIDELQGAIYNILFPPKRETKKRRAA